MVLTAILMGRQSVKKFVVFIWGSDVISFSLKLMLVLKNLLINYELKVRGKRLYRPNFRH